MKTFMKEYLWDLCKLAAGMGLILILILAIIGLGYLLSNYVGGEWATGIVIVAALAIMQALSTLDNIDRKI